MNDLAMTAEELKKTWKDEEDCAFIKGWDFSHIHGRYEEEDSLPWDYEEIIRSVLKDEMKLLESKTPNLVQINDCPLRGVAYLNYHHVLAHIDNLRLHYVAVFHDVSSVFFVIFYLDEHKLSVYTHALFKCLYLDDINLLIELFLDLLDRALISRRNDCHA